MSYPRHGQTEHGGRTTGGSTAQDRPDAHGICIGAERNNASTCVGRLPAKNRGVDSGASLTAFVACVALVFMNAIQPVFAQYNVGTVATPILHYSFDDETFTNKVDNTQATCTGTCSFVEGKVGGKALSTSQGFLKLTPSMPFSIISGWSVCAWFKVNNLFGGFKTALAYWDDSTDGGRLLHMGTNGYSFSEYHHHRHRHHCHHHHHRHYHHPTG
jgi:hypothetical protein